MSASISTYATWDPANKGAGIALSNGNLTTVQTAISAGVISTVGKSSGKWYWEILDSAGSAGNLRIGIATSSYVVTTAIYTSAATNVCGGNAFKYLAGASSSYGATWAAGDVIGFALDMNAGTLETFKNNASQGVMVTGLSGTWYAGLGSATASSLTAIANFGASALTYTPPAGFNAGLY
jgi:hypothetical protein